jgi:hypothetical protein
MADIFKITEREIFNPVAIQNFLCQPSHILHRSRSVSLTISTRKGYLEPRKDLDESSFRKHPAVGRKFLMSARGTVKYSLTLSFLRNMIFIFVPFFTEGCSFVFFFSTTFKIFCGEI